MVLQGGEIISMAKLPSKIFIFVGVILIVVASVARVVLQKKSGTVSITSSSTLMEAIDIAELSTAEFRYRGIAEVYKDEEQTKVQCRVCYDAIVKAGINMHDIKLDVDEKEKCVTATLPDIDIKVKVVDDQSMIVLPSDANIGLDTMLKCSKQDAEKEARESEELITTAQENLKATIEGLLFPIIKPEGYSLRWK